VRQRYQRALQELAPYADVLARGKPGPVERGSIPLGPVRCFVYDGLMLVGDAAGQATPWACMGSESALINGQTCGRVAAKAFKQGDLRAKVLREYEGHSLGVHGERACFDQRPDLRTCGC
jgi:flavin-dependent dehydrogenase